MLAEHHLHHVGGVGANHHEFAMGHVDHAHETKGDGQSQRGQQQYTAQADTEKNVSRQGNQGLMAIDLMDR